MALGEPEADALDRRLAAFDRRLASLLLEAELRSALHREGIAVRDGLLDGIAWIVPDRMLTRELEAVLAAGYLRGPDLWHVACALHATEGPASAVTFLTLDERQRAVAAKLGFRT